MQNLVDCKAIQKKVGENIERIRLSKKKTTKEMSALLKLSDSAYRNLERGVSEIGLTKIFQISAYLNIHYSEILEIDDPSIKLNKDDTKHTYVERLYEICIKQFREENAELKRQNKILSELLLKK